MCLHAVDVRIAPIGLTSQHGFGVEIYRSVVVTTSRSNIIPYFDSFFGVESPRLIKFVFPLVITRFKSQAYAIE